MHTARVSVVVTAVLAGCGNPGGAPDTADGHSPSAAAPDGAAAEPGDAAAVPADSAASAVEASLAADAALDGGADGSMSARGASVPWDEYEAEDAATNGTVLAPRTSLGDIQAEASGRSAVRLARTGDYVELTAARAANSIVVRYAIPDASDGGGIDATLDLYVDGALRQTLPVTSRYSWFYGVQSWQNGGPNLPSKDPAVGGPFHYFDETHALVGTIAEGAKVRLQKDAANSAAFYVVDLVDLEQVPSPLAKPANVLDLQTDCNATPDDGADDSTQLAACVSMAATQGKGVFIPRGTFEVTSQVGGTPGIPIAGVTVQGAGMWYSVLHGKWAGFFCNGDDCRFANFAVLGDTRTRDDSVPENGFNGSAGKGSSLDGIWVEHKKVGFWVGENSPSNGTTDGLVISNSRFRDLFADGVNFCNGTSHSEVVNTHFRYTGDDALAAWSYTQPGPADSNNVFHFDTVQLPWRATCFALYGGASETIADNVCADTLTFPGLQIGGPYAPMNPFTGTTTVQRTTLVRAGGYSFNQEHGALKLYSVSIDDDDIQVSDLDIGQPTYFGVDLQSQGGDTSQITASTLQGVRIASPGEYGIQVRSGARGSITLGDVVVTNPGHAGLLDSSGGTFSLLRGAGNSGW